MNDNSAGQGQPEPTVRPQAQDVTGDVAWLWTHCRALGMTKRSDSLLMRDDVALYAAELQGALKLIVAAYDEYRERGVKPAPNEYADLVTRDQCGARGS